MADIDAVYRAGAFYPLAGIALTENQRVRLHVVPAGSLLRTASELMQSGLVGLWADRDDLGDSRDFARQLRAAGETRSGTTDAARRGRADVRLTIARPVLPDASRPCPASNSFASKTA